MFFTIVHRWNSLLCPPLGFLFNFALLWLILRRTPKEMRVHSHILLQTGLLDIVLLALQCFGQMATSLDRKTSILVQFIDGYFVQLFKETLQHQGTLLLNFSCIWIGIHYLSVFSIAVQFICRFLVLNRNIKVTLRRYLLLLMVPVLCMTGLTCLNLAMISTINILNQNQQQPIDRHQFGAFVDFKQQPVYLATPIGEEINTISRFQICLFALLMLIAYAIICCCGWKMVRFVSKNATLNARLKDLNRQLTLSLIILACFPLFIVFVTFALGISFIFTRKAADDEEKRVDQSLELELYSMLTFHWLPVLNPLTTIFINRPYRYAIVGRFIKIAPIPSQ